MLKFLCGVEHFCAAHERARDARAFAAELSERTGIPVHMQDERLTSFAAEEHLKQSGRTHKQKKKVRDALAAVEMIRDYFNR